MAINTAAGSRGPDVRNDVWVMATDAHQEVNIRSTVASAYGQSLREDILDLRKQLGLDKLGLEVEDAGAFPFTIVARMEALAEACGLTGRIEHPSSRPASTQRSNVSRFRSRLYLPGNTPKYFINTRLHAPDIVILDLEDSVASEEKDAARILVRHALRSVDFGVSARFVRINSGSTGERDIASVVGNSLDGILIPKCESADQVTRVAQQCLSQDAEPALIPIIESALGVERAFDIASASPQVVAVALGSEDYRTNIQASRMANGAESNWALSRLINACRAADVEPLASVWAQVDDDQGMRKFVLDARSRGASGVGCLHPSQVPIAHEAFRPSAAEQDWARQVLEAWDGTNSGVVSMGGEMIDRPIVLRAQAIINQLDQDSSDWRTVS